MKRNLSKARKYIFCTLLTALCSCSQQHNDVEIKRDLTAKAMTNKEFIGVRFVVNNGIVKLSGECPTIKARDLVIDKVKRTYAVKNVVSEITIAPVIIGTDEQLRQSVDSVLKTYPGVQAIVKDSIVQLQGNADIKDQGELLSAIQKLQPKELVNKVTIESK